jgi:hypothetical protein
MDGSLKVGRWLFALAMIFFGVEFFIYARSMTGPLPGPPWTRGGILLAWLICAGFILSGVSIASEKMARWAAMLLGAVVFLFALVHYLPTLMAHLHDPGPWTVIFELLAISGGAFVIAASFPPPPSGEAVSILAEAGRFLIAISLVVFAVQHFMYASFVATLVPTWMPAHLFWAYFTGLAFVAAALSIATKKMIGLAGTLLGTMFLLWVVLLHAPRVAGAVRNGDEVTSLSVALAMSGVGFVVAGVFKNNLERRGF